ncbi:MAG: hypothetical protein LBV72_19260 [Tannerella sp.]|jgi:hypothetical protein|nr:hypothetical protein [Tannerella sp.]
MKKKNFLWMSALCTAMICSFTSCDDDDDPKPNPETETTGVYFLNSGKSNSNNATLDLYNPKTKELQTKIFAAKNGEGLGDTAQDMLVYGSKMYIVVYGSNRIQVADHSGKLINYIEPKDDSGQPRSPRSLAAYNGKIYVTLFDGHVAKIDTSSIKIENLVSVGRNPEQLTVSNGKLFVCNTGGMDFPNYDKTVSVIDINSFSLVKTIEVEINPEKITVDPQGDIYVISTGNYGDIPNTLQRINPSTYEVTKIDNLVATWMSMGANNKLYIVSAQWGQDTEFYVYDTANESLAGKFITDGTVVEKPYSISADRINGNVYIGTSDYTNTGDMYVFSSDGKLLDKKGVSGLNPMGAYFIIE